MLRFPVEYKIPIVFNKSDSDNYELASNEEWMIEFNYKTLMISRKSICKEVFISGWISYPQLNYALVTQEFAHLMKPTSFSLNIELKNPCVPEPGTFKFGFFPAIVDCLNGVVCITSLSENIDQCKNCQSLEKLSNDFERLLDPQISSFADFNFKCGDSMIPTHKNILSARSPVFAAMFAHEMKENQENKVDITDLDLSTVRSMLTYMYTGKVILTVALASDLLPAAHKYQMDDLIRVCCDFLKKNVSPENMLNMYVLGDLYNTDLKSFAKNCICNTHNNFSVYEETKEWKTFKKEKANLALDLAVSIIKSRERQLKGHKGS